MEAEAEAPPCRVLVLANPRLSRLIGAVRDRFLGNIVDTLKQQLPEACRVESVEGPRRMAERAQQAAAEGFERIVVAGGDGTVGLILRSIIDHPIPIGIIPLGTYNNFATSLGIPTDLETACKVAVEGVPIDVDLGRVTSLQPKKSFIFKEIAGVGVDALAFSGGVDVAGPAKIPVGALAVLSAIVSFRPHPVRFRSDGQRKWTRCTQLIVANTPRYGPALPIVPEADPCDGLLHILARTWRGRVELMRELPHIFSGRHGDLESDIFRAGRKVEVIGSPRIMMHADGEFFCRLPVTIEILPRAVKVAVPAAQEPSKPHQDPV